MADTVYRTDVAIVGEGIAGITTTLELLGRERDVLILDRDVHDRFGGLARWSFGGSSSSIRRSGASWGSMTRRSWSCGTTQTPTASPVAFAVT